MEVSLSFWGTQCPLNTNNSEYDKGTLVSMPPTGLHISNVGAAVSRFSFCLESWVCLRVSFFSLCSLYDKYLWLILCLFFCFSSFTSVNSPQFWINDVICWHFCMLPWYANCCLVFCSSRSFSPPGAPQNLLLNTKCSSVFPNFKNHGKILVNRLRRSLFVVATELSNKCSSPGGLRVGHSAIFFFPTISNNNMYT